MVNELQLFSKNESLDDLATAYIRYLTLPAFLGFFTSQKATREERLTALHLSQVCQKCSHFYFAQNFYKEFLNLTESYGIPDLPKYDLQQDPSG